MMRGMLTSDRGSIPRVVFIGHTCRCVKGILRTRLVLAQMRDFFSSTLRARHLTVLCLLGKKEVSLLLKGEAYSAVEII